MGLKTKIQTDVKEAMKSKNAACVSTLRLVLSAAKKKEIDEKKELSEAEMLKLIGTMVKQRHDSIDAFKKGNRPDLVEKEENEVTLLKGYLPEQLSREKLEAIVTEAIAEVGAQSMKDMGKVIPKVIEKCAGAADGKTVSEIVRSKLA